MVIAGWRLRLGLSLSLWLSLRLGLAFRRHDIKRIGLLLMARLTWLTASAWFAVAVLVAVAILIAIAVAAGISIAIILLAILIAALVIIVVALLFDTIAEALISIVSDIVFFRLDLIVRAGIAAWLIGLGETEIMLGVLVEILSPHPVARQHRIARQLNVFVKNLGSIATDFYFRTIALITAVGRITRLPPTTALALIIARPCFPAIHI